MKYHLRVKKKQALMY